MTPDPWDAVVQEALDGPEIDVETLYFTDAAATAAHVLLAPGIGFGDTVRLFGRVSVDDRGMVAVGVNRLAVDAWSSGERVLWDLLRAIANQRHDVRLRNVERLDAECRARVLDALRALWGVTG